MSTGSWVRLSSLGKRWYSLSRRQPSTDMGTMPQSTLGDKTWDFHRPADVEAGRVDYELPIYGQDGQIIDDRVQNRWNSRSASRSEASLSVNSRTRMSLPQLN